jgi:hypothetical protein
MGWLLVTERLAIPRVGSAPPLCKFPHLDKPGLWLTFALVSLPGDSDSYYPPPTDP